MDLTEECFQQTTLKFVGDKQWIQASEPGRQNRTEIPARRTTNGTFPPGSQWTRNPVRTLRPLLNLPCSPLPPRVRSSDLLLPDLCDCATCWSRLSGALSLRFRFRRA